MYTHPMQKDPARDSLYELCEMKFKVCFSHVCFMHRRTSRIHEVFVCNIYFIFD